MADITLAINVETLVGDGPTKALALAGGLAKLSLAAAELGDALSDARSAANLSKDALESLRIATSGEVKELDLLRAAATANLRGMELNTVQMTALARAAKLTADATGGDFKSSWEQMLNAAQRGGRALKAMGIEAEGLNTVQDRLNAIVSASHERMGLFGNRVETVGDKVTQMKVKWDDALGRFSEGFSTSGRLTKALEGLNEALEHGAEDAGLNSESMEEAGGVWADMGATVVDWSTRMVRGFQAMRRELRGVRELLGIQGVNAGQNITGVGDRRRVDTPTRDIGSGGQLVGGSGPGGVFGAGDNPTYFTNSEERTAAMQRAETARGGGGRATEREDPFWTRFRMEQEAATARLKAREEFDTEWDARTATAAEAQRQEHAATEEEHRRHVDQMAEENRRELEHQREFAEEEARLAQERRQRNIRMGLQLADAAFSGAMAIAGAAGLGRAEQLVLEGLFHAGKALVEAAALNPVGAVTEGIAATVAFAQAALVESRAKSAGAKGSIARGSASGGGGAASGTGLGGEPGRAGGGGGRGGAVFNLYFQGQVLHTDRSIGQAVREAVHADADRGFGLDERVIRKAA